MALAWSSSGDSKRSVRKGIRLSGNWFKATMICNTKRLASRDLGKACFQAFAASKAGGPERAFKAISTARLNNWASPVFLAASNISEYAAPGSPCVNFNSPSKIISMESAFIFELLMASGATAAAGSVCANACPPNIINDSHEAAPKRAAGESNGWWG